MTRAKLRGDGDYSWDAAVRPQPKTESRIERQSAWAASLAYAHYWKPLGHGTGYIRAGCPECAAGVRWFTHSLSMPWFPVDVERLFRR